MTSDRWPVVLFLPQHFLRQEQTVPEQYGIFMIQGDQNAGLQIPMTAHAGHENLYDAKSPPKQNIAFHPSLLLQLVDTYLPDGHAMPGLQ